MPFKSQLLIFTRYPKAGTTKTRLIGELGEHGAAQLQKKLTERLVREARDLKKRSKLPYVIHYCGGSREEMRVWLGEVMLVEQAEGDLGARMAEAFAHAFAGGATTAVLVGSDIPDISRDLLSQAFSALDSFELVLGPSCDGGYYLVGMRAAQAPDLFPLLFKEMVWSSSEIFKITTERLTAAGFEAALLPRLRDIDLPGDLPFARRRGLL